MAGRSPVCGSSAAGSTTSFAKSLRYRPNRRPSLPPPEDDAQHLDHFSPRARELFRHPARLCVHRHLSRHGGGIYLLFWPFFCAPGRPPAILLFFLSPPFFPPDPRLFAVPRWRRAEQQRGPVVFWLFV